MKTINYSVSEQEVSMIRKDILKQTKANLKDYNSGKYAYSVPLEELKLRWTELGENIAMFNQLSRDGLADIIKGEDLETTFDDWAGDTYNLECNPEVGAVEMVRQRKNAMQRFNKGVHTHTLIVLDREYDSINGFLGNDFYGSGYDNDFYKQAFEIIEDKMSEYFHVLNGIARQESQY
jgi:hypothetical protein